MSLNFVKDIKRVGQKMTRNGRNIYYSYYCLGESVFTYVAINFLIQPLFIG